MSSVINNIIINYVEFYFKRKTPVILHNRKHALCCYLIPILYNKKLTETLRNTHPK